MSTAGVQLRMKTVAIIGVGLIGGSLGLALRRTKRYRVIGISRKTATLKRAIDRGAIDSGSVRLADAAQADVIVIATPVWRVVDVFEELAPFLKKESIVTDVASVKGELIEGIRRIERERGLHVFVGAHPMAGSHKTGVDAARADLFKEATVVIVPAPIPRAVRMVEAMWRATGATLLRLSAERHDEAVGFVSHLMHLVPFVLVDLLARHPHRATLKKMAAGSFRDVTRVAQSNPDDWEHIFQANKKQLQKNIKTLRAELARYEKNLDSPAVLAMLKRASRDRRKMFLNVR